MLILSEKHRTQIVDLLNKWIPDCEVWAFGSRVDGQPKPHSDLDLLVWNEKPITPVTRARLNLEFEESDLPIKIDVVLMTDVTPEFLERIKSKHVVLKYRKSA